MSSFYYRHNTIWKKKIKRYYYLRGDNQKEGISRYKDWDLIKPLTVNELVKVYTNNILYKTSYMEIDKRYIKEFLESEIK